MIINGTKKCGHCREVLPVEQFHRDGSRPDGLCFECKACHRARKREQDQRRKEEGRPYIRPKSTANHEVLVEGEKLCPACRQLKPFSEFYTNRRRSDGRQTLCAACHKEYQSAFHRRARYDVLVHYGGNPPKCECCGEDTFEFLVIDHINGGGNQHRKQMGGKGTQIVGWLIRNNFPDGFRVLCHNCNNALGHYGYCPHQKQEE